MKTVDQSLSYGPRCLSLKHVEADCRVKYSVTGLKFTYPKWCTNCKEYFKDQAELFSKGK